VADFDENVSRIRLIDKALTPSYVSLNAVNPAAIRHSRDSPLLDRPRTNDRREQRALRTG
jgi:hypothetical protein